MTWQSYIQWNFAIAWTILIVQELYIKLSGECEYMAVAHFWHNIDADSVCMSVARLERVCGVVSNGLHLQRYTESVVSLNFD